VAAGADPIAPRARGRYVGAIGFDMQIADWWFSATHSPLRTETLLFIAVIVLLLLRASLHRSRLGRRVDAGLSLLIVATLALAIGTAAQTEGADAVVPYARAVFVAALAIAAVRIALVLFVDIYLRERRRVTVSAIVRDIIGMGAYFVIFLAVLRATLDINLASLIATSAVLTAIIGLAFQDVLGSIISGLVLEAEEPFKPDDWVRVGTYEGQVVETGWRTTKICTRQNEVIVLPNTYLAREPLVNYGRPDPRHCDVLRFEAAYEAPPNTVKVAVLTMLRDDRSVLATPEPEVHTGQYNPSGIEYLVRYWVEDFANLLKIRDRLLTNVWYALRRSGVRMPFPATDVFIHSSVPVSPIEEGDVTSALSRVPLLSPLAAEELAALAGQVRRLAFARGETVVREGEPGDSFYLVERGIIAITIGRDGTGPQTISRMVPGDYFGEMSLLTGEPRSANVVAETDIAVLEVGRRAFEQILAANPALLEPISQIAAHRQEAQQASRRAMPAIPPFSQDAAAQRLRQRIRAFFGL
jgi:small-conductance mechanosensitive channel/CRP-like cAMP-binding protein